MAFQETKSHSYAHGMIRVPDGHSFGGVAKSDIIPHRCQATGSPNPRTGTPQVVRTPPRWKTPRVGSQESTTEWSTMSQQPLLEGWCTDPFARHEARWLSDGNPTKLVRDGETTAYDEPPDEPFVRVPELIEYDPAPNGADLRRADEAESDGSSFDQDQAYMNQMDAVWSDGAPLPPNP